MPYLAQQYDSQFVCGRLGLDTLIALTKKLRSKHSALEDRVSRLRRTLLPAGQPVCTYVKLCRGVVAKHADS